MKEIYEIYTFKVNNKNEYDVTTLSTLVEGFEEAKKLFEERKARDDKNYRTEMRELDKFDIEELEAQIIDDVIELVCDKEDISKLLERELKEIGAFFEKDTIENLHNKIFAKYEKEA